MLSSAHDCSSVLFACHSRIWDESQGSELVVVMGVCMQQFDSTCWPVMPGGGAVGMHNEVLVGDKENVSSFSARSLTLWCGCSSV